MRLPARHLRRKRSAVASVEYPVTLRWLMILGWQIEAEFDGEVWVGVARHVTSDGDSLRAGGCGSTYGELAWQLFSGALNALEQRRGNVIPLVAA
jgi:hypothetical protein